MLQQLSEFLIKLVDQIGYLGVFLACVLESFFPPIPSEIVMFTVGLYSTSGGGITTLFLMCFVGALGNYVGTLPFYLISRYGAETFLPKFLDKWGKFLLISNNDMKKAEKFFTKHGSKTVFLAKFVPGIRSLVSFPAGLSKMNFYTYSLYSIVGSLLWNLFLGLIGFIAYDQKDVVFAILDPISNVIIIVLVLVVILYIGKVVYEFRKVREIK